MTHYWSMAYRGGRLEDDDLFAIMRGPNDPGDFLALGEQIGTCYSAESADLVVHALRAYKAEEAA